MFPNYRMFLCTPLVCWSMAFSFIWRWCEITITLNRREGYSYYLICRVTKGVQKECFINNHFLPSRVLEIILTASIPISTTNTVLSYTLACLGYLFHTVVNEDSTSITRKSPVLTMNFNTSLLRNFVQTLSFARTGREHGARTGREHGARTGREHGARTGREHGARTGREHGARTGREQDLDTFFGTFAFLLSMDYLRRLFSMSLISSIPVSSHIMIHFLFTSVIVRIWHCFICLP